MELFPYIREGAWVSSFLYFYDFAFQSFQQYNAIIGEIDSKEKELVAETELIVPELRESFLEEETKDLIDAAGMFSTSTVLYSCMTIEGFINDYGTVRLGEDLYKTLLERLSIDKKIQSLYLICFSKKLKKNDPVLKSARFLFEKRNELVHPKTKEIRFEPKTGKVCQWAVWTHPRDDDVGSFLEAMTTVLRAFCSEDVEIAERLSSLGCDL